MFVLSGRSCPATSPETGDICSKSPRSTCEYQNELPGPTVSCPRRRRSIPRRTTSRTTPRVHEVPQLVSELCLTSFSASNLAKKAFNVESPSFTPAPQQAASKKSTFSSQAASAAPFTPRGVGGRLPPDAYHSLPAMDLTPLTRPPKPAAKHRDRSVQPSSDSRIYPSEL